MKVSIEMPDYGWECTLYEEGVFDDETRNWRWGFGKGALGQMEAERSFHAMMSPEDGNLTSRIVAHDGLPVALIGYQLMSPQRRGVVMIQYLFKMELGAEVLQAAAAMLFALQRSAIHRIQTEVITVAKQERLLLKDMGFRQEGKRREAIWMGQNSLDTVLLGLTRPEFYRRKAA